MEACASNLISANPSHPPRFLLDRDTAVTRPPSLTLIRDIANDVRHTRIARPIAPDSHCAEKSLAGCSACEWALACARCLGPRMPRPPRLWLTVLGPTNLQVLRDGAVPLSDDQHHDEHRVTGERAIDDEGAQQRPGSRVAGRLRHQPPLKRVRPHFFSSCSGSLPRSTASAC